MGEKLPAATTDTRLFHEVFNASPIGIVVETLEGQPLFVNPAFCSFLGFSEEELRSKHCVDFSPPEDAEKDWTLFQRLRAGLIDHYQLQKRYFRRDGSLVWGHLSISLLDSHPSPLVLAMVEDVTVSKQLELESEQAHKLLRESEERLVLAARAGRMFAYTWYADTDVIERSGEYGQILGVGPGEAETGAAVLAIVHPDDRERVNATLAGLTAENPNLQVVYRIVRHDGAVAWLDRTSLAYFDERGKLERIVGMVVDVTERKQAEEALREYEKAVEGAEDMIGVIDREYRFVLANRQYLKLRNMTKEQVIGHSISEILGKEVFENVIRPKLDECFQGKVVRYERKFAYPGMEEKHLLLSYFPIEGPSGIDRAVCILRDITERRLAEETLRISEERLRLAQWVARIGTYDLNLRTGVDVWQPETEALYGLVPGGFGGTLTDFENLVHPDDRARVRALTQEMMRTGEPAEAEWRVVWPDGSVHWIASRGQVLMDDSGKPSRMLGVNIDVTERKRADETLLGVNRALEEQARMLRSQEQLLKIFVQNVPAGVAMLDRDMRYVHVSDRFCADYGVDAAQILGRSHYELFPDIPEHWKEMHRRALAGELLRSEEDRWDREDGTTTWVRWELRPWMTSGGTIGGIFIFAEDITQRKQVAEVLSGMSRKLIEAQEQERARIARELHDDINQRLAMLSVGLSELQNDPSRVRTRMVDLRRELAQVSEDVQALSHDLHSSRLEYLGIVKGIRSWCKEFAERQKLEIDFTGDVATRMPLEIGVTLFRVLQESLQNAVKHSGVKQIRVRLNEESGEIHLVVTDSGRGFDVEAALRGKGLGLTSMGERVRLVNGTMTVDSKLGSGTTIRVRVPLQTHRSSKRAAG